MKHQITIMIAAAALTLAAHTVKGQGAQAPPKVASFQLSAFAGQLDTNILNTNGLVLPEDVQLLIQDLRVNMSQVAPLLAILNGEKLETENSGVPPSGSATVNQYAQNFGRNDAQNLGQNNGQNFGQSLGQNFGTPAGTTTPAGNPDSSGTNNQTLIYALGSALEDMQADLQELLPRLAALAGQTNYSSGGVQTQGFPAPTAGSTGKSNSAPAP